MLQPSAISAALAGGVATPPALEQAARFFRTLGQVRHRDISPLDQLRLWPDECRPIRLWRDEG